MTQERTTGTKSTSVVWTPKLVAALDAELARRRATQHEIHPRIKWTRSMVSEDILRQALGVGNE